MPIIQELLEKIYATPKKYLIWLDLVFLFLVSAYIFSGINLAPFHGDESAYIVISQDYDRIVKQRDFEHVLLKPETDAKQYLRLTTGSILAYSIGFARDITNNDDPIFKWLWGSSWEENILMHNMPEPRLLNLARICSALMGVLGIILFFLTAFKLFSSHLIAWAGTLALATHGDVLVNIRRAMQEGPKFLFLILTLYIASLIIRNYQDIKKYRYLYVLLGIASGLTLAAKQDTVPMLVAIYFVLGIVPIWKKEITQNIFLYMFYLGTATILAYAVFLITMPVFWEWWENVFILFGLVTILFQIPIWQSSRIAKSLAIAAFFLIFFMSFKSPGQLSEFLTPINIMIKTREVAVDVQLAHNSFSLNTVNNKINFLLRTTFTSRVMYMEASSFDVPPFHEQIKAYESSFLGGRIRMPILDIFLIILAVIGGWSLLRYFNLQSLFVYSLFFISGILLFFIIPLPWQRYFLIMQIPYSLIVGVGANQIWEIIRKQKNLPLIQKQVSGQE